jgi:putative membrane protein
MRLLAVWIINAAALFLVGYLISGVHLGGFGRHGRALVLGLVNALIR